MLKAKVPGWRYLRQPDEPGWDQGGSVATDNTDFDSYGICTLELQRSSKRAEGL
jgi:hypothetical protein